jgi:hypothetical protein
MKLWAGARSSRGPLDGDSYQSDNLVGITKNAAPQEHVSRVERNGLSVEFAVVREARRE